MPNPFLKPFAGIYLEFIKDQLSKLKVGETSKLDVGEKNVQSARMSIKNISAKDGTAYQTKTDDSGDLWVMRTK